eukprot:TRINITY_DN71_c0_g1_i2.p2 TRINITY_DN71_c0_g1~~TRINITY_DN71_c0_g1_i2.p2  ORF type:complete len:293 (+),score=26.40 TRINITY_DN71_c0_g1_i2:64-942(+)
MPVFGRKPTLIGGMCFYILLSLIIVLIVFAGSNGNDSEDIEGGMTVATVCSIQPGTVTGPDNNDIGQCRYRVPVTYPPNIKSLAWSGILENVWGDCSAAATFLTRFQSPVFQEVECWISPTDSTRVRLWSAEDAQAAAPSASSEGYATSAITVIVVFIVVVVVLGLVYVAFKCGLFGDFTAHHRFKPLPREPVTTQSPGRLEAPLIQIPQAPSYSPHGGHSPARFNDPYHPSSPSQASPPPDDTMVKVGLAVVPSYVLNHTVARPPTVSQSPYLNPPPTYQPTYQPWQLPDV